MQKSGAGVKMDFKAEHTSKIDASVIWQTQVGTRDNRGVAHVKRKQIFEKKLSCGSSKIFSDSI